MFASGASPDKPSERRLLLLAESIRAFAGSLSHSPISCLMLDGEEVSKETKRRLSALDVVFIRFKSEIDIPRFPFMRKVFLGAYAELMALHKARVLVWMDNDTVVLQEPREFTMHQDKSLGCRPVHIINIGSPYNQHVDPFWELIYRCCGVSEDRVSPILTHVGQNLIRPYFNAGLLAVRPQKHVLQIWRDSFLKAYGRAEFQGFFEKDERYRVFMHQAVLAGTILSTLKTDEVNILPETYNYPLHLYQEDCSRFRPSRLEKLTTFRYEDFFDNPNWKERIPANEQLKQWIARVLAVS